MLRPARPLSSACLAALAVLVVAPCSALPAAADDASGVITVVVDLDANGSGAFDDGDLPQAGVVITVSDAGGHPVSGTTDDQGEVRVDPAEHELSGGRYFVVADIPAALDLVPVPESETFSPLSTTVDVSTGDERVRMGVAAPAVVEPDAVQTSPPPAAVEPPPPPSPQPAPEPTPATHERDRAAPAPAVAQEPTFALGDRVWSDLDRSGRQDDGEPGVPGTSVQLLDAEGTVLRSTQTDDDGRYLFDDLPAGLYAVRFSGVNREYKLSPARSGPAADDSDPDPTGVTPPIRLAVDAPDVRRSQEGDGVHADHLDATVDAGLAPLTYAVASRVWQDRNRDGIQDPDESSAQARVTLLDDRSRIVAAVQTDPDGRFVFAALAPGTYRLRFDQLGDHRRLTAARVGSSAAVDSDPDPSTSLSPRFRLGADQPGLVPAADVGGVDADFVDTSHGAGVVGSYAIRNRVWNDSDGDGVLSPGELGIGGLRVELLDARETVVATTTTTPTGWYSFDGLAAGVYQLRFPHIPRGLHFTTPGAGADRGADSDVYADARTAPIAVGEDHPVEDAVGAGLTSAPAAVAVGPAPAGPASLVSTSATAPLTSAGGPGTELVVGGCALVLAGGGLLLRRRLRRH